jgi:hypothetical protein
VLMLISQSSLGCGFAVAAFVVSAYDWGEHNKIKELPMSYKYLQHLHSDKRYVNAVVEQPAC